MLVYLVIIIFCGIICSVIAKNKHRSVGGWFLLGMLFGMLSVILVLVLPTKPTEDKLNKNGF